MSIGLTFAQKEASKTATGRELARQFSTRSFTSHVPVARSPRVGNLPVQRKAQVTVGSAADPLEREADRVANDVMNDRRARVHGATSAAPVQRTCAACSGAEETCSTCGGMTVRRTAMTGRSHSDIDAGLYVGRALASGGQPLPARTRSFMEPRFAHDFSAVRVHAGPAAAASAAALGARAFAVGRDVVFGAGAYAPDTPAGQRLIAHELTHVIQQGASRSPSGRASSDQAAETLVVQRQTTDEGDLDAGVPAPAAPVTDAGVPGVNGASQREAQDACVGRLGGCPEMRSGGTPTAEEIHQYNEQCRRETGYVGDDVQPTCRPAPDPGPQPVCRAVMGGRIIDHWTGTILRQEHTYVNFEMGGSRWLFEGGPDPASPSTTGAWVKPGQWESRGNRITTLYYTTTDCERARDSLVDTTNTYHALRLPYDAVNGPNSNSFCEQLTFKTGVRADFDPTWDHRCFYWREHARPF